MASTQDFTKVMQDMFTAFPTDMNGMQDAFRNSAAFGEKMAKVMLEAVEKSNEISNKFTKDTLGKFGTVVAVKEEPTEYTKAVTDFASAQAESAAETMAAFAEVAKKMQMETVELMMAAGKDMSEDATAAVKKETADVTTAAKKVAAAAK